MAVPKRQSDPRNILAPARTFFFTANAFEKRLLFQSDRTASLLARVLLDNAAQGRFDLHAYVVMPNHVHVLLTVGDGMTIEKAAQFIKGGFSYRAKKELGCLHELWQKGYSEEQVYERRHFDSIVDYIHMNPVSQGLVTSAEMFAHSSASQPSNLKPPPDHLRG
jgi:putative transposase